MRTSASQFEIMVSFMERHGDLSKPSSQPHGRLAHIKLWAELAQILNADASGDNKPEEKWKKTWSDLKNNTKKKAAKLHRAATGTGGGPATKCSLTDLEERVLQIINPQAATGLVDVPEVGFEQTSEPEFQSVNLSPPKLDTLENWDEPGPSQPRVTTPPPDPLLSPEPAPTRKRPAIDEVSTTNNKRRPTMTQAEAAKAAFMESDKSWREFTAENEKRKFEIEKERLRLREIELILQAKWQEICAQFLLVLKTLAPNLLKK